MQSPTAQDLKCTFVHQPRQGEAYDWINIQSESARVGKVRYALADGVLTVYSIMIFPEFQGRGYGRQTIEMLKHQYAVVVADRVRPSARDFWRKMGFTGRPDGSWAYTGQR